MYNKRGLSAIVATVLIILLVIAGVTLVWNPVRKLVTNQKMETNCVLANPQIVKACMSGTTLQITISNGAEGEIDGTQIIYGNDVNSLTNTAINNTIIGINQAKTITVVGAGASTSATRIAAIINGETCTAGSISTVAPTCA